MVTSREYTSIFIKKDTKERMDKLKVDIGAKKYEDVVRFLLDFYEKNKGSARSNNVSNNEIEKKLSDIQDHITKIYTMLYLLTIAVTLLSNDKK